MTENLSNALLISAIGMGLVFGAILLLWGVMVLLVRIAPEKTEGEGAEAEALPATTGPLTAERELKLRAAAAAVALALALDKAGSARSGPGTRKRAPAPPPTSMVSGWQTITRGIQINRRRPVR